MLEGYSKIELQIGIHLDYDNDIRLRCKDCGKFLKSSNEVHTFEPNKTLSMDIDGNKRC